MTSLKYLLFIVLGLLTLSCYAGEPIEGYLEAKKYFKTNVPEYPDLGGEPVRYGLDFEMKFPTFFTGLKTMVGADSNVGPHQFSQIAGRFGLGYSLYGVDFGVYHRSNHSIDHTPKTSFLSDNHIYLRYNFRMGQ